MPEQLRLLKLPTEPGALPEPGKVSEMFREYAEPLLYADPAGPSDVDTIRTVMNLAMLCWNLPVYEALGNPLYVSGTRTLDQIIERVPSIVASKLRKLVKDRKTKFAHISFLVTVDVTGATLEDATIVAQARRPVARN
jgi:hypothetical protein